MPLLLVLLNKFSSKLKKSGFSNKQVTEIVMAGVLVWFGLVKLRNNSIHLETGDLFTSFERNKEK